MAFRVRSRLAAAVAVPPALAAGFSGAVGQTDLAAGSHAAANVAFSAAYDLLPGELAPKLALGFAAEVAGDLAMAARHFQLVWTVDRSFVSAASGLARTRLHAGDPAGAITALTAVPGTSSHHVAAQIAAVRIRVTPPAGQACASAEELLAAGTGDHRAFVALRSGEQLPRPGPAGAGPAAPDQRLRTSGSGPSWSTWRTMSG